MRHVRTFLGSLVLTAILVSPVLLTACAAHAEYRVYDPYHEDYHRWDDREAGYYAQWENDTHREHRDFDKREAKEQREYWDWRHERDDRDKR